MFQHTDKSLENLKTCHPDLQTIFYEVIKIADHYIARGFTDEETQTENLRLGKTTAPWPEGKHNKIPSMSVDAYPANITLHPENISERNFYTSAMQYFSSIVLSVAERLLQEGKISHKLIWGANWDDSLIKNTFLDFAHFELVKI